MKKKSKKVIKGYATFIFQGYIHGIFLVEMTNGTQYLAFKNKTEARKMITKTRKPIPIEIRIIK